MEIYYVIKVTQKEKQSYVGLNSNPIECLGLHEANKYMTYSSAEQVVFNLLKDDNHYNNQYFYTIEKVYN